MPSAKPFKVIEIFWSRLLKFCWHKQLVWGHDWSTQLYTKRKAWKKNSGLNGIRTRNLWDTGAVLLPTELSTQQ